MENNNNSQQQIERETARFLNYLTSLNYSNRTIEVRYYAIRYFFKAFPGLSLQNINEQHIIQYVNSLSDYKPTTRNVRLEGIRRFFNWLEKNHLIFVNPTSNFQLKRAPKITPHILSLDELEVIIQSIDISTAVGIRNRAFIELIYSTGIRRSEAMNLKLLDIDFQNQLVTIHHGKGNKDRVVPFGDEASYRISEYLKVRNTLKPEDSAFLWINRYGNKITHQSIRWLFKSIESQTGIKCNCHTLRRSCASHLLANGMNLSMIANILGHDHLASLNSYLLANLKELHSTRNLVCGSTPEDTI